MLTIINIKIRQNVALSGQIGKKLEKTTIRSIKKKEWALCLSV